jgi:hypothetical protein
MTLFTTNPDVSPSVRLITAIASHDAVSYPAVSPVTALWGTDLPVPQHSQMLTRYRTQQYGGGGEAWCSPTSISMVLAYWANWIHRSDLTPSVPEVARGTYDYTYDGTGDWPFNTAYAASFGLTAFVTRMYSIGQIERWIQAGVPVVLSIAFKHGEFRGEPLPASAGHLIVVRGFTRTGDVITNDPAASTDAAVRIVYRRSNLEHVWQAGSHGTVYIIYPSNLHPPATDSMGSW